jgi:hypothetical protein
VRRARRSRRPPPGAPRPGRRRSRRGRPCAPAAPRPRRCKCRATPPVAGGVAGAQEGPQVGGRRLGVLHAPRARPVGDHAGIQLDRRPAALQDRADAAGGRATWGQRACRLLVLLLQRAPAGGADAGSRRAFAGQWRRHPRPPQTQSLSWTTHGGPALLQTPRFHRTSGGRTMRRTATRCRRWRASSSARVGGWRGEGGSVGGAEQAAARGWVAKGHKGLVFFGGASLGHDGGSLNLPHQTPATRAVAVRTADELAGIRRACLVGREVLDAAHRAVRPGVTTDEIDRVVRMVAAAVSGRSNMGGGTAVPAGSGAPLESRGAPRRGAGGSCAHTEHPHPLPPHPPLPPPQVHEAMMEAGAYPSPLNYYNFPKSVCTSVNEVGAAAGASGRPKGTRQILSRPLKPPAPQSRPPRRAPRHPDCKPAAPTPLPPKRSSAMASPTSGSWRTATSSTST